MSTSGQRSYEYNTLCDVCGFKKKASELHKRWDGFMVCEQDWEARNVLDFYRTRNDAHRLPFTRPEDASIQVEAPGYGLQFQPGQNAYMLNQPYVITNLPATIEAMVMFQTTISTNIRNICRYNTTPHMTFRIEATGQVSFYFDDLASNAAWHALTNSSFSSLPHNVWIRVTMVFANTGTANFYTSYLDNLGILQQNSYACTVSSFGPYAGGPATFTIGDAFSEPPPEVIDDLRIWNIARTQQQIYSNWNVVVPINSTGLAAYYKLDEGYVHNNPSATVSDSVNPNNVLQVYGAIPYPHSLIQG